MASPEVARSADRPRSWSISAPVAVGIVITIGTVVVVIVSWNSTPDARWGLNSASIVSIALSLLAILISLSIYRRQSVASDDAEARHTQMMEQVKQSADRAVQLSTTERMMTTAQRLRQLVPDHSRARRVAQALLGASVIPVGSDSSRVLWVDDNPGSIELEVEILEGSGISTQLVESTDAALGAMESWQPGLIISDMGRGSNMRAGYDLVDRIKGQGAVIPVVFYTGSDDPAHDKEASGSPTFALGSTNDPVRLFELVAESLHQRRGD